MFIIILVAAFTLLRFMLPIIVLVGIFYLLRNFFTGGGIGRGGFNRGTRDDSYDPYDSSNQNSGQGYSGYETEEQANPLEERPLSVKDADFFKKQHEVIDVPYTEEKSDNSSGSSYQ
ncbi:MAG: hypothetical protein QMB63_02475 [Clostridiaceae bacterium]